MSTLQMFVRYGTSENTARMFMHKIPKVMESGGNNYYR